MATLVDIFNAALVKVAGATLTSPDDPTDNAAKLRAAWPVVRDAVLRSYPWNCATARAQLPQVLPSPTWGPAFAYVWPADCLRVLEVDGVPQRRNASWSVEGRQIFASIGPVINIRYIRRIEAIGQMDATLVHLLSVALAAEVCYPITGNATKADSLRMEANQVMIQARSIDAQESGTTMEVVSDDWTAARS